MCLQGFPLGSRTANKPINAHVLHQELSCTRIIISGDSTKYADDNINQYSSSANSCNGCVPPDINISEKYPKFLSVDNVH